MPVVSRIQLSQFGKPQEVVTFGSKEESLTLRKGEVLVRMLATPINPADINFIQGNYGVKPDLPTVPGIEGCAEIIKSAASGLGSGDKVIFLERVGTWQSYLVCCASKVLRVPSEIDPLQASMLKVNPATAWLMLQHFETLKPGDWVMQNAANSGVGQCLIQIAKRLGVKTINAVRREGLEGHLTALGADHVLLDDECFVDHVRAICGDHLPRLASNAVGGDSALRQMDALAEQGLQVTFGAMSLRSLKVPNKFLIFKGIQLRGLWLTQWIAQTPRAEVESVYQTLAQWVVQGQLKQPIECCYKPSEIVEVLEHAQQQNRGGKVLVDWSQV